MNKDIICWWSGGVTSAVACKLAIDIFGNDRCRVIMIDTKNEDDDTYRFMKDCQIWYNQDIETITGIGDEYNDISSVWIKYKSLNTATGAICSTNLKRKVREQWQKNNTYKHQIFGFEFDKKEMNRALSMKINHPKTNPLFPLMMYGYSKKDCIDIIQNAGIEVPNMYKLGFKNNNCFKTGCVQGGIGYWKKMQIDFPDKFDKMANMEHELTRLKGSPVTMLKDQGKDAIENGVNLVFLKKNPDYPNMKCIDDMAARPLEPLFECNGFCGINDLVPNNETEKEINFQ